MKLTSSLVFLLLHARTVSCTSCKEDPGQLQCLAFNNRFLLPQNENCDPFKKNCRMGDLIKNSIASCTLKYPGNIQRSLQSDYSIGEHYCVPEIRSLDTQHERVVSVDSNYEPRCDGVGKTGRKTFTCGLRGTRCVCDAPQGSLTPTKNVCRCQYFFDFCNIPNVCSHPKAECLTEGNTITCQCPNSEKSCTPGINQCIVDPGVCYGQDECIELYDELTSWTIGNRQLQYGYACLRKEDIKVLEVGATFCKVNTEGISSALKPKNHIDGCCLKQLKCGQDDKKIRGHIITHRPCYCNSLFRNCVLRYSNILLYRQLASAALRAINAQKSCEMNENNQCDPRVPKKCKKGDLVNPKIAHCKINCKSGPLLPIGQRMCSIRQCKPQNNVFGARVIDVPNKKESSLCQAQRTTPVLCGKSDTRCVCDSKPAGLGFTDRCRCQYWPLEI